MNLLHPNSVRVIVDQLVDWCFCVGAIIMILAGLAVTVAAIFAFADFVANRYVRGKQIVEIAWRVHQEEVAKRKKKKEAHRA